MFHEDRELITKLKNTNARFTTLFDNTSKKNNKYDVKVTNDATVTFQKTTAGGAMYDGFDIVEIPTNALGLRDDFKYQIGNVTFNYNLTMRDDRHFKDNWLKNRYIRNYFKADIANKRFVSLDFSNNEQYEFENFKSERNFNREVQYGYLSDAGDNFLYRFNFSNFNLHVSTRSLDNNFVI
mgnify:CR=1 FL=1